MSEQYQVSSVGTAPGATAADQAAVHTPEPDETEMSAAEAADFQESQESVNAEALPENVPSEGTPEEEAYAADFDDESSIPSEDRIQKYRIPKEVKEEYLRVAQQARSAQELVENLGGEVTAKGLGKWGSLLLKPRATDDELTEAFVEMGKINPVVTTQFMTALAQSVWKEPDFANHILKEEFQSERASVQNFRGFVSLLDKYDTDVTAVEQLLQYDKAGLLDKEYAQSEFASNFENTPLFTQQQEQISKLSEQNQELLELLSDPNKAEAFRNANGQNSQRAQQAAEGWKEHFDGSLPKKLSPRFEVANWDSDGALAKTVTELINYRLSQSEEFRNVEQFARAQGAYKNGDSLLPVVMANENILLNKAAAVANQLVREIQADIRKSIENARRAPQRANSAPETPSAPAKMPSTQREATEQTQAQIDAKFKQRMAALRESDDRGRI